MNLGLMDLNSWSRQGSEEEDMKQKDLRLNETNKKKKPTGSIPLKSNIYYFTFRFVPS